MFFFFVITHKVRTFVDLRNCDIFLYYTQSVYCAFITGVRLQLPYCYGLAHLFLIEFVSLKLPIPLMGMFHHLVYAKVFICMLNTVPGLMLVSYTH